MDLYQDLPGVELTIKDGNLILPAQETGTQRVLIIAPTSSTEAGITLPDSITTDPKRIKGSADIERLDFGKFNRDNPLATKWKQAHDAGCRNISVLELQGIDVEENFKMLGEVYDVLEGNDRHDIILLDGVYADTLIDAKIINETEEYESLRTSYVSREISDRIKVTGEEGAKTLKIEMTKNRFDLNVRSVMTESDEEIEFTIADPAEDGGDAVVEITNSELDDEVLLVRYSFKEFNFASQLGDLCKSMSEKNNQVLGIVSLKDPSSSTMSGIKKYIDKVEKQYYNQFIQVVGGPTQFFEINNEPYEDNFSGSYAGLISVLPSYSSPTNKVVPGALFPSFNLSESQVGELTNKHVVVPRVRNGRVVIADAVTTADTRSDFVRLTTVRIVNDAIQLVREICEPYIGEPNTLPRRGALETQINTALQGMIRRGALNDYRFNIKANLEDQLNGNMRIALDLVPVFETRRIFVTVALKPSL